MDDVVTVANPLEDAWRNRNAGDPRELALDVHHNTVGIDTRWARGLGGSDNLHLMKGCEAVCEIVNVAFDASRQVGEVISVDLKDPHDTILSCLRSPL
jgi:hypothetical protein